VGDLGSREVMRDWLTSWKRLTLSKLFFLLAGG
jgi:hypothetical protein